MAHAVSVVNEFVSMSNNSDKGSSLLKPNDLPVFNFLKWLHMNIHLMHNALYNCSCGLQHGGQMGWPTE